MIGDINVGGILVDPKILTAKFACDYEKCHGYCCNSGDPAKEFLGCDLEYDEAAHLLFSRKVIAIKLGLPDKFKEHPLTLHKGVYFSHLKEDGGCIYCTNTGCGLKDIHKKFPEIDIPLSCVLYPICVEWEDDTQRIYIAHLFDEQCHLAYEKGEKEGIYLTTFLKNALIRAFGVDWYNELLSHRD